MVGTTLPLGFITTGGHRFVSRVAMLSLAFVACGACQRPSSHPPSGSASPAPPLSAEGYQRTPELASTSVPVKILGFNDFHGQLHGERSLDERPVGGAAVMAAYLEAAAARVDGRALIVHAGDHVGASPPASALMQDEPAIEVLNVLANEHCRAEQPSMLRCNVVGTLGNHEFDEGAPEMLRLIRGGNHARGPFLQAPYAGARFEYVSANVVNAETGRTLLPAFVVRDVGPVKVGLVGAVLKGTPEIVTPLGVAGLKFLDEAPAINRAVQQLRARGVEAIGVLIHQGGEQARYPGRTRGGQDLFGPIVDIVRQLDDAVDFVVSGHAHAFTNAFVPNEQGKRILVTQALSAGSAFADIDLTIDLRSGDVVDKSAEIVVTYADVPPGDAPHPAVAALVESVEQRIAPLVDRVVARAAMPVSRDENDAGESALGNLVADAQRAATGADVAFVNPGGIRANLDAGTVTWGELFSILPFGNSLVTMDLTGRQLLDLLNQQWAGAPRILKTSGLTYTWDTTRPAGTNRIVGASIGGKPLDPARTYRVVVNSFTAAGGDRFTVLRGGTNRVTAMLDLDALVDHLRRLPQPFTAAVEGRIEVRH